jgi:hypothetical protein
MVLHVTNGDVVAERLSRLGVQGIILPWREILHEGPLPPYKSLDTAGRALFNLQRAEFIVAQGWVDDSAANVLFDMNQRDALLLDRAWDEIVLWFERDLYDQLLLSQIMTLLLGTDRFVEPGTSLVHSDVHLVHLTDEELMSRYDRRSMVDREMAQHYADFLVAAESPSLQAPTVLHDAYRQRLRLLPGPDGFSDLDLELIDRIKRASAISVHALLRDVNDAMGNDAYLSDLALLRRIREVALRLPSLTIDGDIVTWNGASVPS